MSITPELRQEIQRGLNIAWLIAAAGWLMVAIRRSIKNPPGTQGGYYAFRFRVQVVLWGICLLFAAATYVLDRVPTRLPAPRAALSPSSAPVSGVSDEKSGAGQRRALKLGDRARIVCDHDPVCVIAATERDALAIFQVRTAKSSLSEIIKSGRAYQVKSGTTAMFIDQRSQVPGADVAHVYCGTDPHSGRLGWIPSRWLKKQPSPP